MALISNGKRSHQIPYNKAGGDIATDKLDLGMMERETAIGGVEQNNLFGGSFGSKELLIGSFVITCFYLVNGTYAQVLCTALTSIPPAIFSYRVLVNQKTSKDGYHSILFYWTIYGVLALIDQFVGNAQGYNLCKSGLLGTVFLHAVRTNPSSIPKAWQAANEATCDMLSSVLFTKYDSNGFEVRNNSSNFVPCSPTLTQFSDESEYMPEDQGMEETEESGDEIVIDEDEAFECSTACSFIPSLEMQSTQNLSPEDVEKLKSKTKSNTSTLRLEKNTASTGRPPRYESVSAMTMTAGTRVDIMTVPNDKITFSHDVTTSSIRVTNVSNFHVMFALKTNADTSLIAAPTTGFIFSGQSINIRVGVTDTFFEQCHNPGKSIDKLAIDYTTVPQSHPYDFTSFSNAFFQSQVRRRHAIRVFYQ